MTVSEIMSALAEHVEQLEADNKRLMARVAELEGRRLQYGQLDSLPDVFLCANDFVAGDAMRALFLIGKSVPEDVRLLGFDDSPESRVSRPTLSTIHIHTQIMAFTAMQLLISRMKEPSLDYRVVHTQTDLILRESTAP